MICLAGYGGAWLAGRMGPEPPPLETSSPTFQFVATVGFSLDRAPRSGVADWMRGLQERAVDRLWLVTGDSGPVTPGMGSWNDLGFDGEGPGRRRSPSASTAPC